MASTPALTGIPRNPSQRETRAKGRKDGREGEREEGRAGRGSGRSWASSVVGFSSSLLWMFLALKSICLTLIGPLEDFYLIDICLIYLLPFLYL